VKAAWLHFLSYRRK